MCQSLIRVSVFLTTCISLPFGIASSRESVNVNKVSCAYHNDLNENAFHFLTFTRKADGQIKAHLEENVSETLDDEGPFRVLFNDQVTVSEDAERVAVTGRGFHLIIPLPISFWNHGKANSPLEVPAAGIRELLTCEISN